MSKRLAFLRYYSGAALVLAAAWIGAASPAVAQWRMMNSEPGRVDWTGFYVGASGGWVWTDANVKHSLEGKHYRSSVNKKKLELPYTLSDKGFVGGIQAGFNWQLGAYVLGVEADLNYLRAELQRGRTMALDPIRLLPNDALKTSIHETLKAKHLFSLRARLGMESDGMLIYGTGGLAYTKLEYRFLGQTWYKDEEMEPCFGDGGYYCASGGSSGYKPGWVIGGGVEWALDGNWSLKAEYLMFDFSELSVVSKQYVGGRGHAKKIKGTDIKHKSHMKLEIARIGVNYRF